MSLRALVVALSCTGTLAYEASQARADSVQDTDPRRELAGHVFFPSLIINDPFVSTYVLLYSAAGYEWIDGPNFDPRGDLTGTRSYRAAAMAQGASFQLGVTDCLAIRVAGSAGLDAGINGRSAVVVGMIAPIALDAGATFSWKLRRDLRFGVTADLAYTHDILIQPINAIQDSIVARDVQVSSAIETLNGYSVLPGVTAAYTPTPALGFLASAQYSWTHVTDGDTRNRQYVAAGASAQLDLHAVSRIPLGFLASYRATIPFESDVRFGNTVEGGAFYTGRKNLDLGIDAQVSWLDLRPDHRFQLDSTNAIGIVELRYHWN